MRNVVAFLLFSVVFFLSCSKDSNDVEDNNGEINGVKSYATKVFDYQYAPGQHSHLATMPVADESLSTIMLGSWGGYVVLGFDYDVINSEGKNLVVYCFGSASPEPGIIYLMDDTNNNGLPDDVWYEVKGSEFNSNSYRRNYSLTYYRPKSQTNNVTWSDNLFFYGLILSSFLQNLYYLNHYHHLVVQGIRVIRLNAVAYTVILQLQLAI